MSKEKFYEANSKVNEHMKKFIEEKVQVRWETLDQQPPVYILETAINCVMANELEHAMIGLMYVLYNDRIEKTNKAEKRYDLEANLQRLEEKEKEKQNGT